jgi:hypothetical protein
MFVARASAVAQLLARHRALRDAIADGADDHGEAMDRGLESLNRLILDVRAGRVDVFQLGGTQVVEFVIKT